MTFPSNPSPSFVIHLMSALYMVMAFIMQQLPTMAHTQHISTKDTCIQSVPVGVRSYQICRTEHDSLKTVWMFLYTLSMSVYCSHVKYLGWMSRNMQKMCCSVGLLASFRGHGNKLLLKSTFFIDIV